jgi:hypothetical protein
MKKLNILFWLLVSSNAFSKEKELDELIKATNENSLAQKAANESARKKYEALVAKGLFNRTIFSKQRSWDRSFWKTFTKRNTKFRFHGRFT